MRDSFEEEEKLSRMADEIKPENTAADRSGPKLDEIDASAGRFRAVSPKDAWAPGLIEVVFKDATQSGVRSWHFPEEEERKEFSEAWSDDLKNILLTNDLLSWKPSFPLRYPWTIESDDEAHKNYEESGRDKFVTFDFPGDAETRHIADALRELPEIEHAVAVPRVGPPSDPLNEPLMGPGDQPVITVCDDNGCLQSQWYIFRCKVDQAWKKKNASGEGLSGKGVVIADIDWGFNPNHQDLIAQIKKTQNMFTNFPVDPLSVNHGNRCHHGTAALGVAGAEANGRGIAGVAFGAHLWAIQAGLDAIEDHSRWVAGIDFVITQDREVRKVIILEVETASGGNIEMIPTMAAQIRRAIADKVVVCVPAGNGIGDAGIGDDNQPIPRTGSILVGATNFDALANIRGISNGGCRVVVYAPGDPAVDVTCGLSDDGYLPGFGGTSSAVAKVAGAVALMLEKNPALTHEQVRDILARSQRPVVEDQSNQVGVLLDAEQAVCAAGELAGHPC